MGIMTEDKLLMTNDELREYETECIKWVREKAIATEAKWRARGYIFTWIDPEPDWITATDWSVFAGVRDPEHPSHRVFRFRLIGGGQIRVCEKWRLFDHADDFRFGPKTWCEARLITVFAHGGDPEILAVARGSLESTECYEMDQDAVVLRFGDQSVADRVAETFRAIKEHCEVGFAAALDGMKACAVCKKRLRDEISKLIGIGPTCAKRLGIEHNIAMAKRALEIRRRRFGG